MSLHIFSKQTKIDFVGMRHYAYGLSALLILVGLITIFMNGGLRYGVDFAGGAAVQLQFEKPVADEDIKKSLAEMELPGLAIQQYGEDGRDYLVRFSTPNLTSEGIRSNILSSLEKSFAGNPASIQRLEMVGPKVGADLRNAALEAMYFAILLITVYISGRFEQRWGTAALLAGALTATMIALQWMGVPTEGRILAALLMTLFLCWRFRLSFAAGAMASLIFDVTTTTSLLVILVLVVFRIPLANYNLGGDIIKMLLSPATAVLALNIYQQRKVLKEHFWPVVLGCLVGSLASILGVQLMCRMFQTESSLLNSLLPTSVTTATAVRITGIEGAMLAPFFAKIFHVTDPVAEGVAIGACSHAVGTSKALEIGPLQGAMSSIALCICGIITSLIAGFFAV